MAPMSLDKKMNCSPAALEAKPQPQTCFWIFYTQFWAILYACFSAFWMLTATGNNTKIQANISGVGKIMLHTFISNWGIKFNSASVSSKEVLEKMGGRLHNANMCLRNFICSWPRWWPRVKRCHRHMVNHQFFKFLLFSSGNFFATKGSEQRLCVKWSLCTGHIKVLHLQAIINVKLTDWVRYLLQSFVHFICFTFCYLTHYRSSD